MTKNEDWFASVLDEVNAERDRTKSYGAAKTYPAPKVPPRPREATRAMAEFERVAIAAVGGYPNLAIHSDRLRPNSPRPGSQPAPPTAEQGMAAILATVVSAGDSDAVLKAGGEWITKVTNAITKVIREADEE